MMSMSKKHFEALADAMCATKPEGSTAKVHDQWNYDVAALTDVCARFNPNFDRTRFLKACGVEGGK